MGHAAFASLLDHLSDRGDPRVAAHLESCPACGARASEVRRLLAAGRRAMSAPAPSRRALARARRIFRDARAAPKPSLLRVVLDSISRPAMTLRRAGVPATRFLRYEGAVTVELQITQTQTGLDLHGQLDPADFAAEVIALSGRTRRTAPVGSDGTFVLRRLAKRELALHIGPARIRGLNP